MKSFQELMAQALFGRRTDRRNRSQTQPRVTRPSLEAFEERVLLSGMEIDPSRAAVIQAARVADRFQLSGVWGDIVGRRANLKARLSAGDGSPVVGESITFRLGSRVVGSARTNAEGVAILNGVKLGSLPRRGYIARTIAVVPARAGHPRLVSRGPLAMPRPTPTPTVAETRLDGVMASGTYNSDATYTATLLTSSNTPVAGKAVAFQVGNQVIGTAMTNASGVASLQIANPAGLNAGSYIVSAAFAGDSSTGASQGSGTLSIARAVATVTVGAQTTTYSGHPAAASAVTTPAGLGVVYTYADGDGHAVASPTNAGVYQVVATVNDPNYTGSAAGSITITQATLTITGLTVADKTYDGTTAATISTADATLTGLVPGDSVVIDTTGASAVFASKNVGTGQTVTVSGLALAGSAAGNYVLASTSATATASITPRSISLDGILAFDRVYDGTTAAGFNVELATLTGAVAGDDVSFDPTGASAHFLTKSAGVNRPVEINGVVLTGADQGNYTLIPVTSSATITPKDVVVTGVAAQSKIYDGTTTATVDTTGAILSGLIPGDLVTLDTSASVGTFVDKNVGLLKTVTLSGLVLDGVDAGNYQVVSPTQSTATISPATLIVTGITASDRVYNGSTAALLNLAGLVISGQVTGDDVVLDTSIAAGNFADRNVGTDKTVSVSGLSLTGVDAGNYTITVGAVTGDITPAILTLVSPVSASGKIYDGTTDASVLVNTPPLLSGLVLGDVALVDALSAVTATGTFADKNVGTDKVVTIHGLVLTGADAGNYTLAPVTTIANITPATVSVTGITAQDKVYDGSTTATIDTTGVVVSGIIVGDDTNFDTSLASGTFADKNVGTVKTVTISGVTLTGADAGNYTLNIVQPTADITAKSLTVTGVTIATRVYDGTTSALVQDLNDVDIAGVVVGDTVTLGVVGPLVTTYADKNVGTGKLASVTGLVLQGADAVNYVLASATGTGDITPATLTVLGISAADKVYDGTTSAVINTSGALTTGVVSGDDVTLNLLLASGSFADKNVGAGKSVTISGVTATGADAGNYTITVMSPTATISAQTLTITGLSIAGKTYDGTTTATYTGSSSAIVTGVVLGDDVSLIDGPVVTAAFLDKNAGLGKTVDVSGLMLSGADSANYVILTATGTADIAKASLVISGITAADKVYDGTTAATIDGSGAIVTGLVAGETAVADFTGASGAFADKNAGSGKAVTISGVILTGTFDPSNYDVTYSPVLATITKKTLTVTGIPDLSKVYDGNQYFTTVDTSGATLVGIVGADLVTLNTAGVFGVSTSENMGTWTVFINGLSLGDTDAGNYELGTVTVNGTITP